MFVPIGDDNPLRRIRYQYVNVALIAANIAVFVLTWAGSWDAMVSSFAVVPQELFQVHVVRGEAPFSADTVAVPERATLFTYMFFHANLMHLASNMLFLWVFGDNIEDALGHLRYLVFYLTCGVAAALFHSALLPDSQDGLIGASGAVSGVIAAYVILHPRVDVWVLALKIIPLRITAALALGFWIVLQFVMIALPQSGPTAWFAHIGGLLAGAILIIFMRRPGVPLFGR